MYCTNQTGEIVGDTAIGPAAIIEFHSNRQKSMIKLVQTRYTNELSVTDSEPIPLFYKEDAFAEGMQPHEADITKRLHESSLSTGFVTSLIDEPYFLQWVRLSYGRSLGNWFVSLLCYARTEEGAMRVDEWCRTVMTSYLTP